MDGAVAAFVEGVRSVHLSAPAIPYLSNVTGGWATAELVTDPSYWGRHIRDTVRFADNVAALLAERESLFIEVGTGHRLEHVCPTAGASGRGASDCGVHASSAGRI